VDSGVYTSYTIPPFYDPMISKLIVGEGPERGDRENAAGLFEYMIVGLKQYSIPSAVMENPRFIEGELEPFYR